MSQRSIASSLAWMGGSALLGQIVTWSATILVARMLTPEDYGLVALSGLFTVFAQTVSEMGVGAAVIQRQNITESQCASLYSISLLIGLGMTGVGVLAGPIMAWFFKEPRLSNLVAFQSLVFVLTAAKSMQRNLLVRETRFDLIGKAETISRIATSGVTLLLAWLGAGYWAIAAQGLWIELFQFVLFVRIKRIRPTRQLHISELREVLRFGVGVMIKSMVGQLYFMADTAILGKIASAQFLGAYGFAKQLTNLPFEKIIRIINQVLYPYLAKMQGDFSAIRSWTIRVAELQLLFITPFFILLFACAEEAVGILLGAGWAGAVLPLKIFCIANIFKLAESYNMNCLTAIGKISAQIRYMLLLFACISAGMLLLWAAQNAEASMYVWITIYPILSCMFTRTLMRIIGLGWREVLRVVWPIFVAQLVMITALAGIWPVLPASPWSAVLIKLGIGIGAYALAGMVLMPKKILFLLRQTITM